jgi:hypothetical protein
MKRLFEWRVGWFGRPNTDERANQRAFGDRAPAPASELCDTRPGCDVPLNLLATEPAAVNGGGGSERAATSSTLTRCVDDSEVVATPPRRDQELDIDGSRPRRDALKPTRRSATDWAPTAEIGQRHGDQHPAIAAPSRLLRTARYSATSCADGAAFAFMRPPCNDGSIPRASFSRR